MAEAATKQTQPSICETLGRINDLIPQLMMWKKTYEKRLVGGWLNQPSLKNMSEKW